MRVKLWGVRGSLPAPVEPDQLRGDIARLLRKFAAWQTSTASADVDEFVAGLPYHVAGGYGGNTSCGEVSHAGTRLLIDAGSGLRAFSEHLLKSGEETTEFHLFFTHFHWDHLIGLPFFAPLFKKGVVLNCYAVHADLEENLRTLFRKPNFPVPYEFIRPQLRLHTLKPRVPVQIGALTITPYQLDHPDPCWGVRVEAGDKSLAWCVDTEGTRTSRLELDADLPLYQDADLMVFDAQYSFGEGLEKINWGHSSGPIGIDLAIRERIKHARFVHHDPGSSDEMIHAAERQTAEYFRQVLEARARENLGPVDLRWAFGREGEVIEL